MSNVIPLVYTFTIDVSAPMTDKTMTIRTSTDEDEMVCLWDDIVAILSNSEDADARVPNYLSQLLPENATGLFVILDTLKAIDVMMTMRINGRKSRTMLKSQVVE